MCRKKTIIKSRKGPGRFAAPAALLLVASTAAPAPVAAAAAQGPASACCTIPGETLVEIELMQDLRSGRNRTGELFPIRLAAPIVIDGRELAPAGAAGVGEVIHSAPRRLVSHAPGELIIALRYVEAGNVRIPLHRLQLSMSGREGQMYFMSINGAFSMAQGMGGNVNVPAGTHLQAKVRGDIAIPAP